MSRAPMANEKFWRGHCESSKRWPCARYSIAIPRCAAVSVPPSGGITAKATMFPVGRIGRNAVFCITCASDIGTPRLARSSGCGVGVAVTLDVRAAHAASAVRPNSAAPRRSVAIVLTASRSRRRRCGRSGSHWLRSSPKFPRSLAYCRRCVHNLDAAFGAFL